MGVLPGKTFIVTAAAAAAAEEDCRDTSTTYTGRYTLSYTHTHTRYLLSDVFTLKSFVSLIDWILESPRNNQIDTVNLGTFTRLHLKSNVLCIHTHTHTHVHTATHPHTAGSGCEFTVCPVSADNEAVCGDQ